MSDSVTRWPTITAASARAKGQRVHKAWGHVLGRLPWEWFVTLTFRQRGGFGLDRRTALRRGRNWCQRDLEGLLRKPIGWVIAAERGRGGGWHCHALLLGLDARKIGLPLEIWRTRNGRADARSVYDAHGIALYTSKEAADQGEAAFSEHLARYLDLAGPAVVVPFCADDARNEPPRNAKQAVGRNRRHAKLS